MLKNFVRIKASPLKNSKFFYSTPKEILNFYNLSLENSKVPQPGGADIKCNSLPIPVAQDTFLVVHHSPKTVSISFCIIAKILQWFQEALIKFYRD